MRNWRSHIHENTLRAMLGRAGVVLYVMLFALAGAPNLAMPGLGSTSRTEHESKPPVSEEEHRVDSACPDSPTRRPVRLFTLIAQACSNEHVVHVGARFPSLPEISHRRVLDKQNGLGAFLRC